MLCGSNSDFRSRTFSASISVSNSRNFSLRYCFAARTTGLSLYLGIIITPDLIFLFYTVSEVYTISKEVSLGMWFHLYPAANRFYYLCAVLDLFARKIVSLKLSGKINTQPAIDTVNIALSTGGMPYGLMFHTDRGSRFTSEKFGQYLDSLMYILPLSLRRSLCNFSANTALFLRAFSRCLYFLLYFWWNFLLSVL